MSVKREEAEPAADYKVMDRDVILGDRTNTRLANRLLSDFVALHHQLGYVQEETLDHTSHRLANLMKNGLEGVSFLYGKGHFVKISGVNSTIATEDDAIDFVKNMLKEEMNKPAQQLQLEEEEDEQDEEEPKENGVKENGEPRKKRANNGDKESSAMESEANSSKPGDYDVKIAANQVQHNGNGNMRLQLFLDKYTADDNVTIMTPHLSRVKAALLTLRRIKSVSNASFKARFVLLKDQDSFTVLDDKDSAEFVLCRVFDELLPNPVSSFANYVDLKSLIPSIGTAEISQFMDFFKPGTTPIQDPTEFDVLFGRGGMTNSHPGNKRFRDVISLHRPDYVRAIKIEKPNVARRIVAAIRGGDPPGRFMKRNPKDLMWYDVGNRHATEKTSQALREKSQAEKNGKASPTSETDVRKRLLEQALCEARVTRMRLSKEGGSQLGNCLDPETFKLLVPSQYGDATYTGLVLKGTINGNGAGKSDAKDKENGDDKALPKISIPFDLKDMKMTDSSLAIGPSSSIGLLDENGAIAVTENDILCGRGGLTNHHKGNKRFRDVVALHRPDYVRAAKVHKPAVARMIVKAIRNSDPPGRFLKKDGKTDNWLDIGDKRAAEKASQALREKSPEERTKVHKDTAEDSSPNSDDDEGAEKKSEKGDERNGDSKQEPKNGKMKKEAEAAEGADAEKGGEKVKTDDKDTASLKVELVTL